MSNRTLVELNHDFAGDIDEEFVEVLRDYLRSATRQSAGRLERFGAKVVGMRHHSKNYIIDAAAEGFPARFLSSPQPGDS